MTTKENISAVLYGVDDLRMEHANVRPIKDLDVLLEMKCVGICGSDVHYWKQGGIGKFVLKEPMILGHEASGVVKKCGPAVKNLKEGDRVAIEPGVPCFMCSQCKTGKYNLCPDMEFCATPPINGNLCQYYVHHSEMCYKLPDNVSFEEAALLEPLAVGVHSCKRGNVTIGSKVLIIGAGPVGLVTIMTAKYMGAQKILVVGRNTNPARFEMAEELGAHTLTVTKGQTDEQFTQCVEMCLNGPPDVSIDCSGFEVTVKQGIIATKPGGTMVISGMGGNDPMSIPIQDALMKEVDIRGIFRYANDYEDALAMVASGEIPIKRLVTHDFKLSETIKAFEMAHSRKAIKVMIHCDQ